MGIGSVKENRVVPRTLYARYYTLFVPLQVPLVPIVLGGREFDIFLIR